MKNKLLFFSTSLDSSPYYKELDTREIEQTAKTFFKSQYMHTTSLTKNNYYYLNIQKLVKKSGINYYDEWNIIFLNLFGL